jgi:hypothetical protein
MQSTPAIRELVRLYDGGSSDIGPDKARADYWRQFLNAE